MSQNQEFVIRAAGADKAALRHLVARFPLAFRPDPHSQATAQAPDLRQEHQTWLMGQMEAEEAKPGTRACVRRRRLPRAACAAVSFGAAELLCVVACSPCHAQEQPPSHSSWAPIPANPACCRLPGQWVLEERSGRPRFVGQPEGGLRDTGAGYFLLMKVTGAVSWSSRALWTL